MVIVNLDLVRAFEQAVTAGDVEAAAGLVTDDIEVGGPRGSASGLNVFRRWVASSGISLETVQLFGRGDTAVAVQKASWAASADVHTVATEFGVRAGRICRVIRYDDGVDVALAAAGLGRTDELPL
ncbi:nuclear transport factor 2 family protein [Pseudonocardia hispaniensis]|uniref:nuclear transport factor 2 family protein n=1 Tax=Pseudonocardia hispaniensis TaxID=904933 RepID=UPI0036D404D4